MKKCCVCGDTDEKQLCKVIGTNDHVCLSHVREAKTADEEKAILEAIAKEGSPT